ncbi:MAG: hypothetical protein K0S55_581 [Clostridia bacterium]|nr:hypothetical protein [Clostridia bacterium]
MQQTKKPGKRGIVILREDLCPEWIKWMKDGDLNVLGIHELPDNGNGNTDKLLQWLNNPESRALIKSFEDEGITVEFELHAMTWLLPRELFNEHPEWFRVNSNNIRTNDLNLCPSSREALAEVQKNAYKLASQLCQNSHLYHFWLDDAISSTCCCDSCKNYSGSDQNMIIMNEILKGIRKYDPRAELSYLAYADALVLPSVKPDNGIFLEFAPMSRDHSKPLNFEERPENINYVRLLKSLLEIFSPEKTQILEYWLDNALYSGYRRPPVKVPFFTDVVECDAALYKALGIDFISSFGSFIGKEYLDLHGVPPIKEYGEILLKA